MSCQQCIRFFAVVTMVTVMFLSFFVPVRASDKIVSPDTIPGTTKVDAEGLLDLVDKIPGLTIIDARIRQDRAQGYIEGSVSLPDIDTTCASLAKAISTKSSPVLFYCNGVKCGRSVKSSRQALTCGYTQVYWFRGGFEEWKQKDYPFLKE